MFSATTIIVLTASVISGVLFGTDLSRPVNLFPGALITILSCALLLLHFDLLTPLSEKGLYFLIGWLSLTVIYLVEKQRPLREVNQKVDQEVKWWLKRLIKAIFQK